MRILPFMWTVSSSAILIPRGRRRRFLAPAPGRLPSARRSTRCSGGIDGTARAAFDELSLYNRLLTTPEIQALYLAERAGKCTAPTAPVILQQPADQIATAGDDISLSVIAAGSEPMSIPMASEWHQPGQRHGQQPGLH